MAQGSDYRPTIATGDAPFFLLTSFADSSVAGLRVVAISRPSSGHEEILLLESRCAEQLLADAAQRFQSL